MKTATIKPNQSALDMVLMACGTVEAAMQVMAANNQSITTATAVGNSYLIPDDATTDPNSITYLQQRSLVIGTKGE